MGCLEALRIIVAWRLALGQDLCSLFLADVAVEVREADAEIPLHQTELRVVCLIIAVLIGATAVILNVFVNTVFSPVLKSWRLILNKLRPHSSSIIKTDKPVFISISLHTSVPRMEDIPGSLVFEGNWRVNVGDGFTKLGVFALLVVDFAGGVGPEGGAGGGRPTPKRSIIRRTICPSIITCITAVQVVQIVRLLLLLPLASLAEGHVVLELGSDY